MEQNPIEQKYPITFRKDDSNLLGQYLKNRQPVVLIGMKRVGISSFLRFFLTHQEIQNSFIKDGKRHLFIPVDLNDLVEREIFPFWMLTLKRIVDYAQKMPINLGIKKSLESLFLDSIQSKDLFLVIENIRRSLNKIIEEGYLPTIFFIRFDRIVENVNSEFFSNLQGLKSFTNHRLSFIFTSYRSLDLLNPKVFTKASLSVFCKNIYFKPAKKEDMEVIFETYREQYKLKISLDLKKILLKSVDGYVQYLQLALIFLHEHSDNLPKPNEVLGELTKDEGINLQSEELYESLSEGEKELLGKIIQLQTLSEEENIKDSYLFATGMIIAKRGKYEPFSPLFSYYLTGNRKNVLVPISSGVDFTKKELLLFQFLKNNLGSVCERDNIISSVWPEEEELGVSDWALDRLVARVRNKIKTLNEPYEVVTVKTRGYKLIQKPSILRKFMPK